MPPYRGGGSHRARHRSPELFSRTARTSMVWSEEQDDLLWAARAENQHWSELCARHFPDKTPNACRKRHERLREMRKAKRYEWARFPELTSAYVEVREEMWKMLVDRLEEKMDWKVIEKTVIPLSLSLASVIVILISLQDLGSRIQDRYDRKSRVPKTEWTRG
jgi:Myb-like DNA-binding protein